jgi:hypothetical protein
MPPKTFPIGQKFISKSKISLSWYMGEKRINHSQFVDDTLLIGGASIVIAKRLKNALDNFTHVSGALINSAKSNIYTWNTPPRTTQLIANIFCFPLIEKWQTFKYLGIPICLKSLPNSTWNQILDKIKNKLDQWGSFWLNLADQTVLLKSVLSCSPHISILLSSCTSEHQNLDLPPPKTLSLGRGKD